MSKERAKNRSAHGAGSSPGTGSHEHQERLLSMKTSEDASAGKGEAITQPQHHKHPKGKQPGKNPPKSGGKGRPTPKQSAARTPSNKKRANAPVGRPDGPLARRRRFRIRLLVSLLLVVNLAAALIWRDWAVSLAVLIGTVIVAPLLAAALLRRK
ncbi:MAG TPA: hypothetical protein VFZ64_15820 [Nocardioidaceae bacterium]